MKPLRSQKVVVAYPHAHEVSARFHKSLLNLFVHDAHNHGRVVLGGGHLANSSGANIVGARNEIVEAFLDTFSGRDAPDWLWFIDTDMTFAPDILDRLVAAAHPEKRPILGALCFALLNGDEVSPTVYGFSNDQRVVRYFEYPRDQLFQVGATGTGCLLIHRSVLEKMRGLYEKPYQWFQETALGLRQVGEDITFCIRAGMLEIPIHVDSRIRCGHEKPFVVNEEMFQAQKAWGAGKPHAPTFVVIPVKDRHEMTVNLISQLQGWADIFIFDNGSEVEPPDVWNAIDAKGQTISQMWNAGLDLAAKYAAEANVTEWNVAILNNDIEVPPGFLAALSHGLRTRDDFWIAYPNYHGVDLPDGQVIVSQAAGGKRTMSGWAFMVRGESGLRVDEQFEWWYGDDDLQLQVESTDNRVVCVGGCTAKHLEPNVSSQTPEKQAIIAADRDRFFAKWSEYLAARGG